MSCRRWKVFDSAMHYPTVQDGEWVQPKRKGYKMMCCDCGLVHKINFRLVGRLHKRIQSQAFRDNRATAAARRKKRILDP